MTVFEAPVSTRSIDTFSPFLHGRKVGRQAQRQLVNQSLGELQHAFVAVLADDLGQLDGAIDVVLGYP